MKQFFRQLSVVLVATLTLGAFFATWSLSTQNQENTVRAAQTIPYKINFQGRLTDNNGNTLADGTYNMRFRLNTAPTGGSVIWTEDRTGVNKVTVENGLFNIQFGDVASLAAINFTAYPLYLEIELPTPATATGGSPSWTEGPMSPRQPLASSAYAFNADKIDGLDGDQLARKDAANTYTGTQAVQATAASALTVQTAAGAATVFDVNTSVSKVAIGGAVNTGGATLQVNGTLSTTGTITVGSNTSLSTTTLTIGGTAVCNASGCTAAASSGSYIQNQDSVTQTGDFKIDGVGTAGGLVANGNGGNGVRIVGGNYGSIFRQDGSNWYFLLTASGDQYGTWNTLRPLAINNTTGLVTMQNGLTITGGNLNVTGTIGGVTTLTAQTVNATTGLQTGGTTRIDASGNVSAAAVTATGNVGGASLSATGNATVTGDLTVRGVNAKGYNTTNTGNTNIGQYTKLTSCTITGQFWDCRSLFDVVSVGDGNTAGKRAAVDFRVKQQAALGSAPYVNVDVYDTDGLDNTDFVAVTTVNTASQTVVELYGKIDDGYQHWLMTPRVVNGSVSPAFVTNQGFSASLPSGTQTVGSYVLGTYSSLQVNGTTNSTGALTVTNTVTGTTLNGTVGINTGAGAGTQRIDASGNLVNIGNITGTAGINIQAAGTNTLSLDTAGAGTVSLGTNAATINLGGGTGNETINIGNSSGTDTINFATGAGTNNINIGTNASGINTLIIGGTGSTSTTKLQGGASALLVANAGTTVTGTLAVSTLSSTTGTTLVCYNGSNQLAQCAAGAGSGSYIQNGTAQQSANFNISGNGTISGILTVTGTLGSITTSASGNNLNFSRNGTNYITATDAAGTLALGVAGSTGALTINANGTAAFAGNLAVGTSAATNSTIIASKTYTDPGSVSTSVNSSITSNLSSANAQTVYGVSSNVAITGTGNSTGVVSAVNSNATFNSSGTGGNINAGTFYMVQGTSGGGITSGRGQYVQIQNNSTTTAIGTATGIEVATPVIAAGGITNYTGIKINPPTSGAVTTNYGIQIGLAAGATTNAAINLSDTTGALGGGILFGTDARIYRSGSGQLQVNGSLASNATLSGNVINATTNLQTNGVTRIDSSGNVTAAGVTASGTVSGNSVTSSNNVTGNNYGSFRVTNQTNSIYGSDPGNAAATPFGNMWHDILAFNRYNGTPTFEQYDGSAWNAATLNSQVFAQMDATPVQIINGTSTTGARYTWNSNGFQYAQDDIAWLVLKFGYTSATAAIKTITVETSSDGTNWTTRAAPPTTSEQNVVYAPVANWANATWLRVTITQSNGQPVGLNGLQMMGSRSGSQGIGQEYSYPYGWDASMNLSTLGSGGSTGVLKVGSNSNIANTGGIYFGADTNLYRGGNDLLKTDDALQVGTNLTVGGVINTSGNITTTGSQFQRNGAGTYTLDLNDAAATTLALTNGGTGVADLQLTEGSLKTGSGGTVRLDNAGNLLNIGTIDTSGTITVGTNTSLSTSSLVIGGTTVCTSTGCTAAASSGSYIQNGTSAQTANFNITGNGVIGGTLGVSGAITGNSTITGSTVNATSAIQTGGTTRIDSSGNLTNIGTVTASGAVQGNTLVSTVANGTAPITVTSQTVVNNLNADMVDGFHANQLAQQLRAGYNLTGGGTVTWNGSALAWTTRFISISNGNGSDHSTNGYFDMAQPTTGTVITGVGGASNATVTASGVPLSSWQALYYILPIGSSSGTNNANYRVAQYSSALQVPSNWVLVAIHNADNSTLRLGTGMVLRSNQTTTAGSVDNVIHNTSVTAPLLQNAGTLTLAATGANQVLVQTNGTTRLTVDSAGLATFANGVTLSAGNLTVSSGTISASGNITSTGGTVSGTNVNATSNLQTNGTTRIDSSGNVSAGNVSATGVVSGKNLLTYQYSSWELGSNGDNAPVTGIAGNVTSVKITNAAAYDGTRALEVITNASNTDGYAQLTPTTAIPLRPSTKYAYSAYVRGVSGTVSAQMYVRGQDGTFYGGGTVSAPTGTWTRIAGTFTTNAAAQAGYVRIDNDTASATAYYDALMLEEVPTAQTTASGFSSSNMTPGLGTDASANFLFDGALIVRSSTTSTLAGALTVSNTITGTTLNGTVGINTGAGAGTQRIDSSGNLVNIGNITGLGGVAIQAAGTNTLTLDSVGAGTVTIGSNATTVNLGNGAGTNTLNIGANASATNTITVGTTNTSSSTRLQGGGSSVLVTNSGTTVTGSLAVSSLSSTAGSTLVCYNASNQLAQCATSAGSGSYIQNGTSAQTADFNITGNGVIGGTLGVTGAITGSSTITGTTLNATTGVNTGAAGGTQRITAAGALTNITGYTQSSGQATFNQNAADQFRVIALQAPTTDMVNISNSGQPVTTAGINGLQVDYYGGAAAVEASAAQLNITPGTTSGGTWNALRVVANAAAAGVVSNAIKLESTAGSGTQNGLYFNGGWDSLLNYNGTSIIGGTGLLQSAGFSGTYSNAVTLSNASNSFTGSGSGLTALNASNLASGTVASARISGAYSGITGVGAMVSGSIASGFGTIATGNTITGTVINGTTGINTGAGAGTQRIDVNGNITAGTISATGDISTNGKSLNGTFVDGGAGNLVSNGNFETGLTGWTANLATITQQSGGYFGASSIKMVYSGAGDNYLVSNLPTIPQTLANRSYTFSFWAKADSAANTVSSNFLQTTNGGTNYACDSGTVSLTTSWQHFKFTCTWGAGITSTQWRVALRTTTNTGNAVYYDGVQVQNGTSGTDYQAAATDDAGNLTTDGLVKANALQSATTLTVNGAATVGSLSAGSGAISGGALTVSSISNSGTLNVTGTSALTGAVGIGTSASSTDKLIVSASYGTATAGEQSGIRVSTTYSVADTGLKQSLRVGAATTHTTGTVATLIGTLGLNSINGSGGTTTDSSILWARTDVATGATVTNAYGVNIQNGTGAGTMTNQYGIYVNGLTKGAVNYAVYTAGTTQSYFGGAVQVVGALTTGAINAGANSITTTGTLSAGAATVTSLNAGSGAITTTGTVTGNNLTTGGTVTAATANITGDVATRAVNAKGYVTTNTSNLYNGQYTKLASCTITTQYWDCHTQFIAVAVGDGGGGTRATVDWRVKQQNALGGIPTVSLEVSNTNSLVASQFTSVTTVNTGSQTVVELWGQINATYQSWAISPLISTVSGTQAVYFAGQGFQASLPSSTSTTVGSYASVTTGTLQSAGSLTIQSAGTNAINMDTGSAGGTISIGAVNATTINVGGGTAAETLNIGNSSGNTTMNIVTNTGTNAINIGTSATAINTLIMGSTNASSSAKMQGGVSSLTINNSGSTFAGSVTTNSNLTLTASTGTITINGNAVCTQTGCTPQSGSSNYIQNQSGSVQSANLNMRSNTAGVATAVFSSNGSGDAIVGRDSSLNATFVLSSTGNALFRPSTNSTAAFRVQNSTSTQLIGADTTNMSVTVGTGSTGFSARYGLAAPGGSTSYDAAAADFTGDGRTDAMVTNSTSNNLVMLTNNGTNAPTMSTSIGTNFAPRGIVAADFNADGRPDIAYADQNSNDVRMHLNTGSASWFNSSPTVTMTTGSGPYNAATGDFNADGRPDIVVVNYSAGTASVFINTGSGVYFPTTANYTLTTGTSPRIAAVGDFNGDGKDDVAVGNWTNNTISVFINTGTALPTTATYSPSTGSGKPYGVAAADINGDGRTDLVAALDSTHTIGVFLNGGGRLAQTASYSLTAASSPYSVIAKDFNGDGRIDVASTDLQGAAVRVYMNEGGKLPTVATQVLATTQNPYMVTAGDFNGDGKLDLLAPQYSGGGLALFANLMEQTSTSPKFTVVPDNKNVGINITTAAGNQQAALAVTNVNGETLSSLNADGSITIGGSNPDGINFSHTDGICLALVSGDCGGLGRPALGDITGDGKLDLVVPTYTPDGMVVWSNTGTGYGSVMLPTSSTGSGAETQNVKLADVNGDGRLDAIAFNYAAGTASVFLNSGSALPSAVSYTINAGTDTYDPSVGDFNGDGRPDVVTAIAGTSTVRVFINSAGTLPTNATTTITTSSALDTGAVVKVGDFNADGKSDAAVLLDNGTVAVYVSNGSTLPSSATYTLTPSSSASRLATGDINNDSKDDLVVGSWSGTVDVYINSGTTLYTNGNPSYIVSVTSPTSGLGGATLADLNNDGYKDLVTTLYGQGIAVNMNKGGVISATASFKLPTKTEYQGVYNPAIGDVNNDGKADIVTNGYSESVQDVINVYTQGQRARIEVETTSAMSSGFTLQGSYGQIADYMRIQDYSGNLRFAVTKDSVVIGRPDSADSETGGVLEFAGTENSTGSVWQNYVSGHAGADRLTWGKMLSDNTYARLMSLDQSGNLITKGSQTASSNPDIAEMIPTATNVEAADVIVADPDNTERAIKSTSAYQSSVIGVVADGTSSFVIDPYREGKKTKPANSDLHPMVLAGRVPVKVTNEGGVVKPGDYLTASSTPGHAMKATRAGATIGKALEAFDGTTGSVLALINISYYNPTDGGQVQGSGAGDFAAINVSGLAEVGALKVTGNVEIAGDLFVKGHLVTTGDRPTVEPQPAAGSNASVTIDGNDTSGTITIVTGAQPNKGDLVKIIFNKAYGAAPRIVLSPSNDDAASLIFYKGATTTENSILKAKDIPVANKTYQYDYVIVETKTAE